MVTKSEISPQRKLGSLRNLRLILIRYKVISVLIFVKIRARIRAHEPKTRACAICRKRARLRLVRACACTDLYENQYTYQLISYKKKSKVS